MNCKYCGKRIDNKGSLSVHETYYCSLNENRKEKKSNLIEYNNKLKSGELKKIYSNQYVKAKMTGSEYIMSEETRKKLSLKSKNQFWSKDRRNNHSISMKNAVKAHPESYSAKNVCGRTKKIEYNGMYLTGTWELTVAKYLDKNNIKWTNIIEPFEYVWEQKIHYYFPDFYLKDIDLYIEVKGLERDRDIAKWSVVQNLMIIKKETIYNIIRDKEIELKINNPYYNV